MTTRHVRIPILLALFFVCALLGCDNKSEGDPGAIFVSGRIEGDETNLAPKLGGRIQEITVREGDRVEAGQPLVRLSAAQTQAQRDEAAARVTVSRRRIEQAQSQVRVLEERLRQVELQQDQAQLDSQGRVSQAEGEVAVAQAELARATAEVEQNRVDAQRYSELSRKGAVPVQTAEQYATKVKTSEAQLEAARKRVAAAEGAMKIARSALRNPEIRSAEKASLRGQWEEAKTQIQLARAESEQAAAALRKTEADVDDLTVTAPFDGTVITRAAEPGQVVAAGTTILTIVDMSHLYLRGFVPEGQIGSVKVGQSCEVLLDSAPDKPLAAEVMRVDPEAMFTPENTYFKEDRVKQVVGVKLLLKEGYGNVKLGMPADARILIGESRQGE